jgi:transcriptional regulator with XRE-family HTH domain
MSFSSNIKLLRKRKDRTQDEVAFALGMKRSTLSGYENGVAEPGIDALITFSKYYGVAIDTLLTVNLSTLSESQFSELDRGFDVYIKGTSLRVLATTVDLKNNENIELVTERAKAGYAAGYADPEYISELPVFQLPFLSKNKKYRTFQISGDSMYPSPEGSWVTGEFVQDWTGLQTGEAYIVFTSNDGIVFKVVENLLSASKGLKLYSLNPLYKPYEVPASEVVEVWKFVNYISSELPDPAIPRDEVLRTITNLRNDISRLKTDFYKDSKDSL